MLHTVDEGRRKPENTMWKQPTLCSAEPSRSSCILNENFLRFHLQDKHNAS